MKACVFAGILVVIVNGCPIQKINIQRGLKQGDPLPPFLFLPVVEGLSGLVARENEIDFYSGFMIGTSRVVVLHLQYGDDTLLMDDEKIVLY